MSKRKSQGSQEPDIDYSQIATWEEGVLESEQPVYRAVAVKDVTDPRDHYPAFQPMIVMFQGARVLSVELIGKRDLFHAAFTVAQEYVDPREKLEDA